MKTFEAFEIQNLEMVYGGDLVVTYAGDIYDTDIDRIIYL